MSRPALLEKPPEFREADSPATVDWDAFEAEANTPVINELAGKLGKVGAQSAELTPVEPLVRELSSLEFEPTVREWAARLFGHAATHETVQAGFEKAPATSLLTALWHAKNGDPEARKLVEMNVRTDMIERSIKAGHVMKITLQQDAHGHILQHGQTAESIQLNSLRFASGGWQMRARTEAETRNMYRMEAANQKGLLNDYYFVVFSRAADDMTPEQAKKAGFFVDTMSMAIQATTAEGDGLTTESAFVAGKRTPDAERHDDQTLQKVGRQLKANLSGTATQLLDRPHLIHKSLMPNGVIDLAKIYSQASGTFFGEDKLEQDYLEFLKECRRREQELEPTAQTIVNRLIAESEGMRVLTDATRRLSKLSAEMLLRRALTDEAIDVRVFGLAAAEQLEAARHAFAEGNYEATFALLDKALEVEESSSCPTGGKDNDLDCDFMSACCPICGTTNVFTRNRKLDNSGRRIISGSCGCTKIYKKDS